MEVIVRSPAKADGSCGDTAQIEMDLHQARELAAALFAAAGPAPGCSYRD